MCVETLATPYLGTATTVTSAVAGPFEGALLETDRWTRYSDSVLEARFQSSIVRRTVSTKDFEGALEKMDCWTCYLECGL